MWLFLSVAGDVSYMGDSSEPDAEALRAKLETETWQSPTVKREFRAEDRDQIEAELFGPTKPGEPWWKRRVRVRGV